MLKIIALMNNSKVEKAAFTMAFLVFFSFINYAQVPSSKLSKLAINRNKVVLQNELKSLNLKLGSEVFIRIYKLNNELEVWLKKDKIFQLFKTYKICYYSGKLGTKTREGDGQAPEGIYQVFPKQMNPFSNYHLSFNIGYPNNYDQANGYTGSSIMVHGNCVSIGCYAMTDPVIEQIWTIMDTAFNNHQKSIQVFIFPFKFNEIDLEKYSNHESYLAWKQLAPIDMAFNKTHIIPTVKVQNGKYILK